MAKRTKKQKLLSYLGENHNSWFKSESLAVYLQVSERTIRKYVKEINEETEVTRIISSAKGYRLDSSTTTQLTRTRHDQTPHERTISIMKSLLKVREKINVYDLAE